MNKITDYANSAYTYAEPYFNDAKNYASGVFGAVRRNFNQKRRRAKRRMLMVKIKRTIDFATQILLIVAAIFAVGIALIGFIDRLKDR